MAAHIDKKSDDSWELAESYMDLCPPKLTKLCAKTLTYLDKLTLAHYFEVLPISESPLYTVN